MSSAILLYGGSFDPPHHGHLKTACAVQAAWHFDRFIFLPCKTPALKTPTVATAEQRIHMLELALAKHPEFSIDTREMMRAGPSYMVDTLHSMRQEVGNNIAINVLMGTDVFQDLPKWHRWNTILSLCNLLIIQRPGMVFQESSEPKTLLQKHEVFDKQALIKVPFGKIYQFNAGNYPISSTLIRERIRTNQDVEKYLPKTVLNYIKQHNLY